MSAWLTMPTHRWPSITGSRRTLCCAMVCRASSTESSAPMVTTSSCVASSPTRVEAGSLPCAITFTTMSRSVSIPLRRSSSPQIGSAPTSSSASRSAASSTLSRSPMQLQSPVMMSRAFLSAIDPPSECALRGRYPLRGPGDSAASGIRRSGEPMRLGAALVQRQLGGGAGQLERAAHVAPRADDREPPAVAARTVAEIDDSVDAPDVDELQLGQVQPELLDARLEAGAGAAQQRRDARQVELAPGVEHEAVADPARPELQQKREIVPGHLGDQHRHPG